MWQGAAADEADEEDLASITVYGHCLCSCPLVVACARHSGDLARLIVISIRCTVHDRWGYSKKSRVFIANKHEGNEVKAIEVPLGMLQSQKG